MKKTYLYLTLLCAVIMFNGCSKKSSNNTINYTVNGLSDVTVNQYFDTSIVVVVGVAFNSGTQEAVTLTPEVDSLPTGVTVDPSTLSGTPAYAGTFTFKIDGSTPAGTYPILINASSASSGTRKFRFNLNILANSNCDGEIASVSAYTVTNIYAGDTNTYSTIGYIASNTTNRVHIYTEFLDIVATLNCTNSTLSFPADSLSGISAGTGTFTGHKVIINRSSYDYYNPTVGMTTLTTTFTR